MKSFSGIFGKWNCQGFGKLVIFPLIVDLDMRENILVKIKVQAVGDNLWVR
jgi:hypothetical protein